MTKMTDKIREGETKEQAWARVSLSSGLRNSLTVKRFSTEIGDKSTEQLHLEIERKMKLIRNGDMGEVEDTLVAQAITLDSIFHEMALRASLNMEENLGATETYLRLALKAQSQCRTTIDSLAEIKNPRSITITKQANIAGQQVVNNGVMNTAKNDLPRTGKNKKPSNELLEEIEHERVDSGTTTATSKEYQKVETVEKVNGGKDTKGKSQLKHERL